jgi:hypothetical protein
MFIKGISLFGRNIAGDERCVGAAEGDARQGGGNEPESRLPGTRLRAGVEGANSHRHPRQTWKWAPNSSPQSHPGESISSP